MTQVPTPLSSNEEFINKKKSLNKSKSKSKLKSKESKNVSNKTTTSLDCSLLPSPSTTSNIPSLITSSSINRKLDFNNNIENYNKNNNCNNNNNNNNNININNNNNNSNNNNNNSKNIINNNNNNNSNSNNNNDVDNSNQNQNDIIIENKNSTICPSSTITSNSSTLSPIISNSNNDSLNSYIKSKLYEISSSDFSKSYNYSNDIISQDLLSSKKLDLGSTPIFNENLSTSTSNNFSGPQTIIKSTDSSLNNLIHNNYNSLFENECNSKESLIKKLNVNSTNEKYKNSIESETLIKSTNKNTKLNSGSLTLLNSTTECDNITDASLNLISNNISNNMDLSLVDSSIIAEEENSSSSTIVNKINYISTNENSIDMNELFKSESINNTLSDTVTPSSTIYQNSLSSLPFSSSTLLTSSNSFSDNTQILSSHVLSPASLICNTSSTINDLKMTEDDTLLLSDATSFQNNYISNQDSFEKSQCFNPISSLSNIKSDTILINNESPFSLKKSARLKDSINSEEDSSLISTLNTYQQLLMDDNKENLNSIHSPKTSLNNTTIYNKTLKNNTLEINKDISSSMTKMVSSNNIIKNNTNNDKSLSEQELYGGFSSILKNLPVKSKPVDPLLPLLYQNKNELLNSQQEDLLKKTNLETFTLPKSNISSIGSSISSNGNLLNSPSASFISPSYNTKTVSDVTNSLKNINSLNFSENNLSSVISAKKEDHSNINLHPDLNISVKTTQKNVIDNVNQQLIDSIPKVFNNSVQDTFSSSSSVFDENISNNSERMMANSLLLNGTSVSEELLRKQLILEQTNKALLYQNQDLNNYLLKNKQLNYQSSLLGIQNNLQSNPLLINDSGLRKSLKRKMNYYHPYSTIPRYNNLNVLNRKTLARRSTLYQQNPNLLNKNLYMYSHLPSTTDVLYSSKLDPRNSINNTPKASIQALQNINSLNNLEKMKQNYEFGSYNHTSPLPIWNQQIFDISNENDCITSTPLNISQDINYFATNSTANNISSDNVNSIYNSSAYKTINDITNVDIVSSVKPSNKNIDINLKNSPSLSLNYNAIKNNDNEKEKSLIGLDSYYLSKIDNFEVNENKEKVNIDNIKKNKDFTNENNVLYKSFKEENNLIEKNINQKNQDKKDFNVLDSLNIKNSNNVMKDDLIYENNINTIFEDKKIANDNLNNDINGQTILNEINNKLKIK
eukprot:jgi/Orpsp1_1/1180158/evm.model.c7180000072361.1